MKLNAPTQIVFLIALIVAIVALLAAFAVLPVLPITPFWIMTIAFAVLLVSVIVPGL